MKDTFIFYTEYKEAINCMSDEQAGMLLKALIEYSEGNAPTISDQAVNMVFLTIKPRMDRDREKWEKECKRRSEAGRLGGMARANKAKELQDELSKAKQSQANQADSDSDSDCDCDIKRGKRQSQLEMFNEITKSITIPDELRNSIKAWIEYKAERNERYKLVGMRSLINKAIKEANAYGCGKVAEAISYSMSSGYKGIVWDLCSRTNNRFNNAPSRSYDMNKLEKMLVSS